MCSGTSAVQVPAGTTSVICPQHSGAPKGMLAATISAGPMARMGAKPKSTLCARGGTKSSLNMNLSASARPTQSRRLSPIQATGACSRRA